MKKILSTTAILLCLSGNAFALGNNNGNSNSFNEDNSINPTATANGGLGGSGGNATQGQLQGQIGINDNKSGVKNSGNSQSDSGVFGSGNSANAQIDASRTDNKQKNDISIGGDNYVEAENVVNTAYAPTVIATSDCLGSVSGGGMGTGFGASLGFTTNSKPCNIREDAKLVATLTKDESLVKATLCQSDRIREAYKVTGEYNKYCVGAKATVKTSFFGLNQTSAYEEKDACAYPNSASCIAYKRSK